MRTADIMTFVSMRRYENFTMHNILQGFRVDDCDWLVPPGARDTAKRRDVPLSDTLKRLELLQEFIYWYFDSFIIPILKVSVVSIDFADS